LKPELAGALPTLVLENYLNSQTISWHNTAHSSAKILEEKSYSQSAVCDQDWCRTFISEIFPDLADNLTISYAFYQTQKLPYIVHTDGPTDPNELGYYNILIPLNILGLRAHTVTFEQRFIGPGMAFVKGDTDDSLSVYGLTKDYSRVEGIVESKFPESFFTSYVDHIDPESLDGLSPEKVIQWRLGDIILFDRYRLHSSSSFSKYGLSSKQSLVISTSFK
jgi:hypothetical protein